MHYSSLDMEFLITFGLLFLQILHAPVVVASGLPTSVVAHKSDYHEISRSNGDSTQQPSLPILSQPFLLSKSSTSGSEKEETITSTIGTQPDDAHQNENPMKRLLFQAKESQEELTSHITPEVSNDKGNNARLPVTKPSSSLSDQEDPSEVIQSLSSSSETSRNIKDKNHELNGPPLPTAQPLKASNKTTGTVNLRGNCNFTEQCEGEHTECRVGICKCAPGYLPRQDNGDMCGDASSHNVEVPQADPTMIGVVVGLAFMSITLCVVLQLFARAQFRENRTIFNTPNPRLMNASLLKGSKALLRGNSAGQRSRRGSQVSIASGHDEEHGGNKVMNANVEFGGGSSGGGVGHGSSSSTSGGANRPGRSHRQLSTDKESTPSGGRHNNLGKGKNNFRQDSIGSNALDASSL